MQWEATGKFQTIVQKCKQQLRQWIKGHSGRYVNPSVTTDTRTIGPLCVRLVLGIDFSESMIESASHHWDTSEQQDANGRLVWAAWSVIYSRSITRRLF